MLIQNVNGVSTADAANLLGVTTGRIRQLVRSGTIKCHAISDRSQVVDLESIKKYANTYRKPGPKPRA